MSAPPYRVKAVYNYSSEHDDDLSFSEGQLITVTDEEDADWYYGEYTDTSGAVKQGLFPRNFVERYEPVTPPRPARPAHHNRPPTEPLPVSTQPADSGAPSELAAGNSQEQESEPERPSTKQTTEVHPVSQDQVQEDETPPVVTQAPVQVTKPPPAPISPQEKAPEPVRAVPEGIPVTIQNTAEATQTKPKGPPVADKPSSSSFRDRIAAFNKPAAPVAPPKPGGLGGSSSGSGFVKKAYVAPPPSRNAYVPPSNQAPVAKIYRREEDPEFRSEPSQDIQSATPSVAKVEEKDEDAPKPMSLKERMAMLQQQQLEQQARHAEAASKKAKPKPPPKKPAPPPQPQASGDDLETVASAETLATDIPAIDRPVPPPRILSNESKEAPSISSQDHQVLEGNLTDEPEPAKIGDLTELETEHNEAAGGDEEADEGNGEVEGDEEEEDVDPEVRRRMELRERMAKMSGGMGMGAMFGAPALPGMGAKKVPKSKSRQSSSHTQEGEAAGSPPQAIPVMPGMAMPGMALPGMGVPRPKKEEQAVEVGLEVGKESEVDSNTSVLKRDPDEVPDVEDIEDPPSDTEEAHVQPEKIISPPRDSHPPPEIPTTPRVPPPVPQGARPPPAPAKEVVETPKRQSTVGSMSSVAERAAPPVPQRASGPEDSPMSPPAPSKDSRPPQPPSSLPERPANEKRASKVPPIPGTASEGISPSSQPRGAPPPPPPGQPPRPQQSEEGLHDLQPVESSRLPDDSEEEDEEEDEEDIEEEDGSVVAIQNPSAARHSEELHHSGLPSLGPQTRPPPPPSGAPRGAPPPPPPSQPPRQSTDMSRRPPPLPPSAPPPAHSPPEVEDYDPFNYQSNSIGGPPSRTISRVETGEALASTQDESLYTVSPPQSPSSRAPPPPPPHAVPLQAAPPPPPQTAPQPIAPPTRAVPPSQAPAASPQIPTASRPRQSMDTLGVTHNQSRRSIDVPRPSMDQRHEFMAADVELDERSRWWARERVPPPIFQGRPDVVVDFEESNAVQGDGSTLTAKRVYALFMDYSQTIITARFTKEDPSGIELQQRHEPPPARLRQDQLEAAHAKFGARIATAAKQKENHVAGDGSPVAFVNELVRAFPEALPPVGIRAFGATVYANMANATVQQHDEIRPGDIVSFRNAKMQGHRGAMKQKYSLDMADHVGVVVDWDGTKKKVRAWEQGRESKKVKMESFKLGDLRSGEVKVWRVMSKDWVGWGST